MRTILIILAVIIFLTIVKIFVGPLAASVCTWAVFGTTWAAWGIHCHRDHERQRAEELAQWGRGNLRRNTFNF